LVDYNVDQASIVVISVRVLRSYRDIYTKLHGQFYGAKGTVLRSYSGPFYGATGTVLRKLQEQFYGAKVTVIRSYRDSSTELHR
jgi:hypothetical protein